MENEEQYFINPDGIKLLERVWIPDNVGENKKFRAFVFIIHGLSEHSSFYYEDPLVQPLLDIGCLVATHDHLGHGRSEGDRELVENVQVLVRDVIVHVETLLHDVRLTDRLFTVPVFLYGHSLGGLMACHIVLQRPGLITGGMVLESAAVQLRGEDRFIVHKVAMATMRLLSTFLLPRNYVLLKPMPARGRLIDDNTITEAADSDPIRNNRKGVALRTVLAISRSVRGLRPLLSDIRTPFLVAHGCKDPIVPHSAAVLLHETASAPDKTLALYEDALHILRADRRIDFAMRAVQWIQQRSGDNIGDEDLITDMTIFGVDQIPVSLPEN